MKRHVYAYLLVSSLLLIISACGESGSEGEAVVEPVRPDARNGAVGCYSASFSQLDSSQIGCGLISSFGDPLFDQQFLEEINIQTTFWQNVPATVYAFDECSPEKQNAYAQPNRAILMGYWMVQNLVFGTGSTLPVAGVLAHEWGHQIQFQNGWMNSNESTVRPTELEADMWAGFYMALAKAWTGSQLNSYFQSVFQSGDYMFNSPGHHGTPNQRLAAGSVGFDIGYNLGLTGQRLSYQELHSIFVNEVARITATISQKSQQDSSDDNEQLSYAAQQAQQSIDRGFVDEVLAGRLTLSDKGVSLADVPEQQRMLLGPY